MLENEELSVGVYRAWYIMLDTFRKTSTGKRTWEDMLRANALFK